MKRICIDIIFDVDINKYIYFEINKTYGNFVPRNQSLAHQTCITYRIIFFNPLRWNILSLWLMDNNNLTKKKRKKERKFHSYEKNFVWIFNSSVSTNPISVHVSDIPFYFSYPFPARLRIRVSFLSHHFCFSIMYSYKSVVQIAPICELNWIKLNLVFVFKKKKTRQIYLRTCNTPKTIYYIVCDRIVSPGFRTNFAHDVSRIRKETRDVSRLYALSVSLSVATLEILLSLKQKVGVKNFL